MNGEADKSAWVSSRDLVTFFVHLSQMLILCTYMSTVMPNTVPRDTAMAKYAILGLMPNSATSSATEAVTSPPQCYCRMALVCLMYFILFLQKPTG